MRRLASKRCGRESPSPRGNAEFYGLGVPIRRRSDGGFRRRKDVDGDRSQCQFNEMFFRDVRVPAKNIVGKVNDGWNVAVSTLMYERGSFGARLHCYSTATLTD